MTGALLLAWISIDMPRNVSDEDTYVFPNFNGYIVEVWEWITNFTPRCMMYIVIYPCNIKVNPC